MARTMGYLGCFVAAVVACVVELKTGSIGRSYDNFVRASWGREPKPEPFIPKQLRALGFAVVAVICLVKAIIY